MTDEPTTDSLHDPATKGPSPAREGIRLAATLAVLMVSLLPLGAIVATTATGIAGGESGESGLTPGALPHAAIVATTSLMLMPVLLAPLASHSAGFGARLPGKPRAPRFLAAAALTWLAMGVVGVANPWIRYALGDEQWTGISAARPISDSEMTFLAVNAGLAEEASHLAVPAGLIYMLGSLLNTYRRRHGKAVIDNRRLWLLAATVGPGLALASRAAGHLYQGHVSAVLALVWGSALIAVFLWVRSIWPIMLGHFIYDIPVDYGSWPALIAHHVGVPAILAGTGLALAYLCKSRRAPQGPYTS